MEEFALFFLVGFLAQMIDAALGMAYGLLATTLLLSLGLSPASASATTHAAECVTTGFSALAHHQFGNVDKTLFKRLLLPGIIGAAVGTLALVFLDGEKIKPFIALYLFVMGCIILAKVFTVFPPAQVLHHLIPLGFFAGLLDAIGGGGWGSMVTSTLLVRGNDVRATIGSVNAVEFFVAVTVSATFLISGANVKWNILIALACGGAIASPMGAWICKYVPYKFLLFFVGLLIVTLSVHMFTRIIFA